MTEHVPVLLEEVLYLLEHYGAEDMGKVLDCTLGLGGYARAVLDAFPFSTLWGMDQDAVALGIASERLSAYGDRFRPVHGNFSSLTELLEGQGPFDAVLFDLGVSNLQIQDGERGFSFQQDGPLDMRMDASSGFSASQLVNEASEKELSDIFRRFGEERFSRQIARGVVRFRERSGRIERTSTLVDIIRSVLPAPVQRKMGGHPARRVFQALRIAVNDELAALESGLGGAKESAAHGGVIVAVSYHSLEDRIVKHRFQEWYGGGAGEILTRRPLVPTEEEVERNYKARSAKLRAFRVISIHEGGSRGYE